MCGENLQAKTKCIAIFLIVSTIIYLILAFAAWIFLTNDDPTFAEKYGIGMAVGVGIIVIGLILDIFLLLGAQQESISKCGVWYYPNLVAFIIGVAGCLFLLAAGYGEAIISELIGLGINAYILYIVKSYMEELREQKNTRDPNFDPCVEYTA